MSVDAAFRGVTDSCKIYTGHNGPLTDYSRDAINLREMQDFEYDGAPFRYQVEMV